MLVAQDGGCAICKVKDNGTYEYFSVDHCHKTLKVRGLLCTNCNNGLGRFKDRIDLLDAAIKYLRNSALDELVEQAQDQGFYGQEKSNG